MKVERRHCSFLGQSSAITTIVFDLNISLLLMSNLLSDFSWS